MFSNSGDRVSLVEGSGFTYTDGDVEFSHSGGFTFTDDRGMERDIDFGYASDDSSNDDVVRIPTMRQVKVDDLFVSNEEVSPKEYTGPITRPETELNLMDSVGDGGATASLYESDSADTSELRLVSVTELAKSNSGQLGHCSFSYCVFLANQVYMSVIHGADPGNTFVGLRELYPELGNGDKLLLLMLRVTVVIGGYVIRGKWASLCAAHVALLERLLDNHVSPVPEKHVVSDAFNQIADAVKFYHYRIDFRSMIMAYISNQSDEAGYGQESLDSVIASMVMNGKTLPVNYAQSTHIHTNLYKSRDKNRVHLSSGTIKVGLGPMGMYGMTVSGKLKSVFSPGEVVLSDGKQQLVIDAGVQFVAVEQSTARELLTIDHKLPKKILMYTTSFSFVTGGAEQHNGKLLMSLLTKVKTITIDGVPCAGSVEAGPLVSGISTGKRDRRIASVVIHLFRGGASDMLLREANEYNQLGLTLMNAIKRAPDASVRLKVAMLPFSSMASGTDLFKGDNVAANIIIALFRARSSIGMFAGNRNTINATSDTFTTVQSFRSHGGIENSPSNMLIKFYSEYPVTCVPGDREGAVGIRLEDEVTYVRIDEVISHYLEEIKDVRAYAEYSAHMVRIQGGPLSLSGSQAKIRDRITDDYNGPDNVNKVSVNDLVKATYVEGGASAIFTRASFRIVSSVPSMTVGHRVMTVQDLSDDLVSTLIFAFKGTSRESIEDVLSDLQIMNPAKQDTEAILYARLLKEVERVIKTEVVDRGGLYKKTEIFLVGHSLGGSMASLLGRAIPDMLSDHQKRKTSIAVIAFNKGSGLNTKIGMNELSIVKEGDPVSFLSQRGSLVIKGVKSTGGLANRMLAAHSMDGFPEYAIMPSASFD